MRGSAYLRTLGAGIAVQAVTSLANLAVGLLLIRRVSNEQYGYYVLLLTAVQFSIVLQGSFIQLPMINRLTRTDRVGRADLVGGLHRDQNRFLPLLTVPAGALIGVLGLSGHLTLDQAALLIVGTLTVIATLQREFFRMVLFGYRVSHEVLKADLIYCLLLVGGAAISTLTAHPAAVAMLLMAASALLGRHLLAQALWRHEPWNRDAAAGMFKKILPQGSWSALGGGLRFVCSQGYTYLVALLLSVPAVAGLAATRLPISPANLLSNGVATLMLPTIASWTHAQPGRTVLRRVALSALLLAAVLCGYILLMWLTRDWIFAQVLRKNVAGRDTLLLLWSAIAVVIALRDQLMYFLTARGRFRTSSLVTVSSTIVSLVSSVIAMRSLGASGAPLGILIGELCNFIGMIAFSLREAMFAPPAVSVGSTP